MELLSQLLLASANAHQHKWVASTVGKLQEANRTDIDEVRSGMLDPHREIIHCSTCTRGIAVLLPDAVYNVPRSLRMLGHTLPDNERLRDVIKQLLDIIRKTPDNTLWPKAWQDIGFPRLSVTNQAFLSRVGGRTGGGIDLLKSIGFREEGDHLTLKQLDLDKFKPALNLIENELAGLQDNNIRQLSGSYEEAFRQFHKEMTAISEKISNPLSVPQDDDFNKMVELRTTMKDLMEHAEGITATQKFVLNRLSDVVDHSIGDNVMRLRKAAEEKKLEEILEKTAEEQKKAAEAERAQQHQQIIKMMEQEKIKQEKKKAKTKPSMSEQEQVEMAIKRSLSDGLPDLVPMEEDDVQIIDPPEKNKRRSGRRVGLKNVANTCSFNSLLQTYFMMPHFRNEILRFRTKKTNDPKEQRPLNFMTELQRLFAGMMLNSNVSDPSEVIKTLLTGNSSGIRFGMQEDVHEINCLLLETVEQAFQTASQGHIIKNVFYGDVLEKFLAPSNASTPEEKKDSVAHILLDVTNNRTLYSSLDAYMYDTTLTYNNINNVQKISSFERLPEILIFQLKRTQYDPLQKEAFKLNDSLSFFDTINMDRYLSKNAAVAASKREQVRRWEAEKAEISSKLLRLKNHENLGIPVSKTLEGTLRIVSEDAGIGAEFKSQMEQYLRRRISEAEDQTRELEGQSANLQQSIDNVYSDIEGNNHSVYKLHSVLVHEGAAGVGHYYAYVKDHAKDRWLKFNDASVTEVSEAVVFADYEGGSWSRSAYCLFYISDYSLAQSLSLTEEQIRDSIPEMIKQSILSKNGTLPIMPGSDESNIASFLTRMKGGKQEMELDQID
eukprot:TRINITY_DN3652_c0_g1_i1.p1 TRINITY_DN3652_c0_g1~~TRINITY_DN3652_c0_g1_i1.p1  ORF type:complete len:833 (+),score=222.03 TRINITY_DN3652_c0_g1_i1:169-2667(+)